VPFAKLSLPSTAKDEVAQDWRPATIREYREIENSLLFDGFAEDMMFPLTRSSTNTSVNSTGSDSNNPSNPSSHTNPSNSGSVSPTKDQIQAIASGSSSRRRLGSKRDVLKPSRERSGSDITAMQSTRGIKQYNAAQTDRTATATARPRSHSTLATVSDEHLSSRLFAALPECNILISCGHWDNSIRVTSVDNSNNIACVQTITSHRDCVTCVSSSKHWGKTWVASGSKDCTVMIWTVNTQALASPSSSMTRQNSSSGVGSSSKGIASSSSFDGTMSPANNASSSSGPHTQGGTNNFNTSSNSSAAPDTNTGIGVLSKHPQHILYGHDAAVSCIDIHAGLNLVVSGSEDGTIILHTLQEGEYIRSIVVQASMVQTVGGALASSLTTLNSSGGGGGGSGFISARGSGNFQSARVEDPANAQQPSTTSAAATAAPSANASTSTAANAATSAANTATNGQTPAAAATNSSATGNAFCKATWVGISIEGYIVVYCSDHFFLRTYSINGDILANHSLDEKLYSLILSEDGQVLLTGGDHCLVVLRWVSSHL
jgi:WD40 repeat protein